MKSSHASFPIIEPEGDRCVTLRFGSALDEKTSLRCLATAAAIEQAHLNGILDVIPSFTTVAVHYEPGVFSPSPYKTLTTLLGNMLKTITGTRAFAGRTVKVPVCYDSEYALDLPYVADACGLTGKQIIDLHAGDRVGVFALGFAPGLPYIGVHNEKFDLPRRASPRAAVPAGSVAIANRQTVIYPNTSPGGWHIIGAMPIPLFDSDKPPYAFLLPGDTVEFTPISRAEFKNLQRSAS